MRKKENRSEKEKVEYTELEKKTVKKKRRQRSTTTTTTEQILLELHFKVVEYSAELTSAHRGRESMW